MPHTASWSLWCLLVGCSAAGGAGPASSADPQLLLNVTAVLSAPASMVPLSSPQLFFTFHTDDTSAWDDVQSPAAAVGMLLVAVSVAAMAATCPCRSYNNGDYTRVPVPSSWSKRFVTSLRLDSNGARAQHTPAPTRAG